MQKERQNVSKSTSHTSSVIGNNRAVPVKKEKNIPLITYSGTFKNIMNRIKNDHGIIGFRSNMSRLVAMGGLLVGYNKGYMDQNKKHSVNPTLFINILEHAKNEQLKKNGRVV